MVKNAKDATILKGYPLEMKTVISDFLTLEKPSSEDIRKLQSALNANGAKIAIDGDFGKKTGGELKSYLTTNPTDISTISAWTKEKMKAVGFPVAPHLNNNEKVSITSFLALKNPAKEDVKNIQRLLKKNGLYDMGIDGNSGEYTRKGLLAAIKEDRTLLKGASAASIAVLQNIVAKDSDLRQTLITETKDLANKTKNAKSSVVNDDVVRLQANLALLGYKNSGIDGQRGDVTNRIIGEFQKDGAKVEALVTVDSAPKPDTVKAVTAPEPKKVIQREETLTATPSVLDKPAKESFHKDGFAEPTSNNHPIYDRLKELGLQNPESFIKFATLNAADKILDFIGEHEAASDPNKLFGGRDLSSLKGKSFAKLNIGETIEEMPVKDVHALQCALPKNKRAIGLVQFIPKTLKNCVGKLAEEIVSHGGGQNPKEVESKIWAMQFDSVGQKLLALILLKEKDFEEFLGQDNGKDKNFEKRWGKGKIERLGHDLAGIWAILETPFGNKGRYDGDKAGNKARVAWETTKSILLEARDMYRQFTNGFDDNYNPSPKVSRSEDRHTNKVAFVENKKGLSPEHGAPEERKPVVMDRDSAASAKPWSTASVEERAWKKFQLSTGFTYASSSLENSDPASPQKVGKIKPPELEPSPA